METGNTFSRQDVEGLVHLLAQAGDPSVDYSLVERKRLLLEGIARMIGADVWIWSTSVPDPVNLGDVMTTGLIEGGWENDEQKIRVFKALSDPLFTQAMQQRIVDAAFNQRYVTMHRREIIDEDRWEEHRDFWNYTGLDQLLLTVYPIDAQCYSGVGFHRRLGKPAFSERERDIVHVILRQVDWLHRQGTNLPSQGKVLQLSPRERQTLVLLLSGNTKREVADKLAISEHTVGDYTKQIYKRFEVNSRGALQALFLAGQNA